MMRMTESAGGRGARGGGSGAVGGGFITGVTGGAAGGFVVSSGSSASWSSVSSSGGTMPQPVEIVVADADVTGVRVVLRRPNPR